MDKARRRSVAIINRYLPPSSSITGDTAHEFYVALKAADPTLIIHQICIDDQYNVARSNTEEDSQSIRLSPIYRGKKKALRFIGNFAEGFLLIRKAVQLKSSFVVTFTDPPLLNFWAAYYLKKKGIKWIYWTMDLYPDAFVSAKLITENNFVFKKINRILAKNLPDFVVGLGKEQVKYLFDRFNFETEHTYIPCGVHNIKKNKDKPEWLDDKFLMFCYAGNLGEAHSVLFLKAFIDHLNPANHRLILSLYGSNADEINKYAKSIPNVVFTDKIERPDLAYIDVHLVSLIPEWNHVCVPSKAVSAVCSGGAMLFCGNEKADTWVMLKDFGWKIPYTLDPIEMARSVQSFLHIITKEEIDEIKSLDRSSFYKLQENGYRDIFNFIDS